MRYIADLHIHSRYSRSTSKNSTLEGYYSWAQAKGINLLGSGDFTHPGWFTELKQKLIPDGNGFFQLKEKPKASCLPGIKTADIDIRFCLSAEISSIYKKAGKTRKVHTIIFTPTLENAARINARLSTIGNITSDGRPILGLDPKDLLSILLEVSPQCYLIPAHIWTPWFSLFGAKSGFDTIEECFEELSEYIFAVETGLSSDPKMNWRLSALDRLTLVSNSDAHSPGKLGREANLFDTELSYQGLFAALKTKNGFLGTIEFYPEEGKYHMDGHRKCGVCLEPEQALKLNNLCPVCGKPLTIGVLHRILELADRDKDKKPHQARGFKYLIPLPEILAEILGKGVQTKSVTKEFIRNISTFGNEYSLLFDIPIEQIKKEGDNILAEAIKRMRLGFVNPQPGFDGEFGIIRVFAPDELEKLKGQRSLFHTGEQVKKTPQDRDLPDNLYIFSPGQCDNPEGKPLLRADLNEEQAAVLEQADQICAVIAGPGTGKTRLLTSWLVYLIKTSKAKPQQLLAVTFTNRATHEMRERLKLGLKDCWQGITISTFHSLCYEIIRDNFPAVTGIYDMQARIILLRYLLPHTDTVRINRIARELERYLDGSIKEQDQVIRDIALKYQAELKKLRVLDLAALNTQVNLIFAKRDDILQRYRGKYKYIAVDEFQDINQNQYQLLRYLLGQQKSKKNSGALVIGDPDQAIYGFRGADLGLIKKFEEEFEVKKAELTINYRSQPNILKAAGELIVHNSVSSGIKLKSVKPIGAKIAFIKTTDAREEARYIARTIKNLLGGIDLLYSEEPGDYIHNPLSFGDIGILARTHAVLQGIIPFIQQAGIPTSLKTQRSFFDEPPFSHVAAVLRFLQNRYDLISLKHILVDLLKLFAEQEANRIWSLLSKGDKDLLRLFDDFTAKGYITEGQFKNVEKLFNFLESVTRAFDAYGIKMGMSMLFDRFIKKEQLSPLACLKMEEVLETAQLHNTDLNGFMKQVFLSPVESQGAIRAEKVLLLTFHAAKGLEFPVVFLVAAEEGITPLTGRKSDIEEERRLFYVAMTRAKLRLFISHAQSRKVYGQQKDHKPSRFMREIPPGLLNTITIKQKGDSYKQLELF